jgi:hypothetical protein
VNQAAIGFTRFYLDVEPIDLGNYTSQNLGILGSNTSYVQSALASIGITNYSGYSTGSVPEIIPQNTYQANDTVSLVHGAHSIKFGVSVELNQFGFYQLSNGSGSLSFAGYYSGLPFGDYLLGLPSSSSKATLIGGVPMLSYKEVGTFVQDQWRATKNLTITAGLRWDIFTPITERYDRQADYNPSTGGIDIAGQNGISSSILATRYHNISPRVGLAYRLGNKTVLRAAYGLYYFNEQGTGGSARLFINYPFSQQYSVTCSSTTPCLTLANGIPNALSPANLPNDVYIPTPELTSNMQQWNFTLEQQIAPSLVARASYVGTRGDHLYIALDEDTAYPGPGSVPARRPNPNFAQLSSWESDGISNYNALQLSMEKRMSAGLSVLASYTYSRSLDMGGGGNSASAESRNNVQNPRDVATEYGLSDFNYTQRFTLSEMYDLPVGRPRRFLAHSNRVTDAVLGGWALASIVTAQTGAPGTLTMATSTANTGTTQYPNRICNGNLPSGQRTVQAWFNTSCFQAPAAYTWGNAGRNIMIAPGLATWDFSMHKDFAITERMGLTLRGEFFNILNKPNFGYPNTSIGSAAAGTITSVVGTGRQTQVALRLHW